MSYTLVHCRLQIDRNHLCAWRLRGYGDSSRDGNPPSREGNAGICTCAFRCHGGASVSERYSGTGICPCCKKCRQPYAAWLSELSQALMEAQQRQAYSYTEVAADFDQIWIEHADKLYESSGLKQEDMEYIYNLGQTIGYLDVQAQEEGLALLQADLGRHIRELEAEAKDRMRLSLVVGSVAGVLLIIILI